MPPISGVGYAYAVLMFYETEPFVMLSYFNLTKTNCKKLPKSTQKALVMIHWAFFVAVKVMKECRTSIKQKLISM